MNFNPRTNLALIVACLLAISGSLRADDTIYTQVDEKPVPLKTPPPRYPESLKRDGTSGIVAVSIVIDEEGNVIKATVAKSTNPEFDKPAMDAVEKWKFKPAKKEGNAVKVKVTVPLRFSAEQ
ncbi:energy transducer TonB [Nibricoccus sp. IMCC34717]|uniref:energy transducer TonB n=1 Tax=Nibricoccus sp. IMCC34717 TaxID=3034021 RepID=UPI00384E020C